MKRHVHSLLRRPSNVLLVADTTYANDEMASFVVFARRAGSAKAYRVWADDRAGCVSVERYKGPLLVPQSAGEATEMVAALLDEDPPMVDLGTWCEGDGRSLQRWLSQRIR